MKLLHTYAGFFSIDAVSMESIGPLTRGADIFLGIFGAVH